MGEAAKADPESVGSDAHYFLCATMRQILATGAILSRRLHILICKAGGKFQYAPEASENVSEQVALLRNHRMVLLIRVMMQGSEWAVSGSYTCVLWQ